MAFNRTIAYRLFHISKTCNPTLTNCRISSSRVAVQALIPPNPSPVAPDPGDDRIHRRFLQSRPIYQSAAATAPELRSLPRGEELVEKIRGMDIERNRKRLEGLIQPPADKSESATEGKLTVEDARKLLRVSQLQTVKSELRRIKRDNIPLDEFVRVCSESCGSRDQGLGFAKMLDESGSVIVLGNVVFLRPDQVVKVVQNLMPAPVPPPNHQIWNELREMEKQKAAIDKRADSLVRRELWCGLGYLVVQTAAFMRLTFWELTWDVMEPICFYVTSVYFMAGYAFFLRTSKEPSFEGFFQSRFNAKQKRLMKIQDFDMERYSELRRACYPHSLDPGNASSFTPLFGISGRTETSALH